MSMRFELDSEVNALYIYFREIPAGCVARTVEVEAGVNLDVDSESLVLGMEFIDADDFPSSWSGGHLDIPEREEDIRGLVA